jgi:Rad51
MNPEEVLDNVICARAHNSEQQMELLSEAAALMSDSRCSHSFFVSLFFHFFISSLLHFYYYCSIAAFWIC